MHRTAYTLLCFTTLFWGGNAVAGRLAVGHVSPMLLTGLRWALAVAVIAAFAWPHLKRDRPVIMAHLPLLAALGATGFTAFNAVFYSAAQYTSAVNIAIEQGAMPMVIFLANFVLFRIGVTALQVAGFVLSIAGVALVASHGDPSRLIALDVNVGDALMMLAAVLYSAYTVSLRFKPKIHWMSTLFVLALAAFVAAIPLVVWEYAAGRTIVPDMQGLAVVVYAALFPSILAQQFFIRGNELIGANRAGLFINLVPIFGTLLSVVVLREAFHPYHALALVMVLGGIWLAEHSGRKRARMHVEAGAGR